MVCQYIINDESMSIFCSLLNSGAVSNPAGKTIAKSPYGKELTEGAAAGPDEIGIK